MLLTLTYSLTHPHPHPYPYPSGGSKALLARLSELRVGNGNWAENSRRHPSNRIRPHGQADRPSNTHPRICRPRAGSPAGGHVISHEDSHALHDPDRAVCSLPRAIPAGRLDGAPCAWLLQPGVRGNGDDEFREHCSHYSPKPLASPFRGHARTTVGICAQPLARCTTGARLVLGQTGGRNPPTLPSPAPGLVRFADLFAPLSLSRYFRASGEPCGYSQSRVRTAHENFADAGWWYVVRWEPFAKPIRNPSVTVSGDSPGARTSAPTAPHARRAPRSRFAPRQKPVTPPVTAPATPATREPSRAFNEPSRSHQ
jgi:hypothetical protein